MAPVQTKKIRCRQLKLWVRTRPRTFVAFAACFVLAIVLLLLGDEGSEPSSEVVQVGYNNNNNNNAHGAGGGALHPGAGKQLPFPSSPLHPRAAEAAAAAAAGGSGLDAAQGKGTAELATHEELERMLPGHGTSLSAPVSGERVDHSQHTAAGAAGAAGAAVAGGAGGEGGGLLTAAAATDPLMRQTPLAPGSTAIVILAYNRPEYLTKTLAALARQPSISNYPVYVSQDGHKADLSPVVSAHPSFHHVIQGREGVSGHESGIFMLARHYRLAFDLVFVKHEHARAIVLEDDMEAGPDFLNLFESTAHLLDTDPTVWCVGSWNDNGFTGMDLRPDRLFRNSFFPGLGWMLRRQLWVDELRSKWPAEGWDHWMRTSDQHKGRDCIVPEVSRNRNIGVAGGATMVSDVFTRYIARVQFYQGPPVDFGGGGGGGGGVDATGGGGGGGGGGLDYLSPRSNAENELRAMVRSAVDVLSGGGGLGVGSSRHSWKGKIDTAVNTMGRSAAAGGDAVTFVIAHSRHEYKDLAAVFNLNPDGQRTTFMGATVLRSYGCVWVLIDRALSPLMSSTPKLRLLSQSKRSSFTAEAGAQGQSCDQVCRAKSKRCDEVHFDYIIQDCATLRSLFPCPKGCDFNVGPDIPNFVSNPHNHDHYGKCLITSMTLNPTCVASHWSTSRLCPCV